MRGMAHRHPFNIGRPSTLRPTGQHGGIIPGKIFRSACFTDQQDGEYVSSTSHNNPCRAQGKLLERIWLIAAFQGISKTGTTANCTAPQPLPGISQSIALVRYEPNDRNLVAAAWRKSTFRPRISYPFSVLLPATQAT